MRIRYYKNEFIFKERGKKLSSMIGYSEILCKNDGSMPISIFKNDSEKQCIIDDDDFIINIKIFKGKTLIIVNTIDMGSIKNINGRYEIELCPSIIVNNIEQIPSYFRDAVVHAIERANTFNCNKSVFIA